MPLLDRAVSKNKFNLVIEITAVRLRASDHPTMVREWSRPSQTEEIRR
jgi:hypothetical protein